MFSQIPGKIIHKYIVLWVLSVTQQEQSGNMWQGVKESSGAYFLLYLTVFDVRVWSENIWWINAKRVLELSENFYPDKTWPCFINKGKNMIYDFLLEHVEIKSSLSKILM